MKRLYTLLWLFFSITVSAQNFQVKTGGEFPVPSEWKNITWSILDYDGSDILAYSMPKPGKFKLVRFDDHFNIKNSTETKTEWHIVDVTRHDDRIDLFAQTSGKVVYYAIDVNTLKLRNQKVLFNYEHWSVNKNEYSFVQYDVQWSPEWKYVGITCFAHRKQDGMFPEFKQVELHLYDSNLDEILSKEVYYKKYDIDKKVAMRSSPYPAHYTGEPRCVVTDEGEYIYLQGNQLGVLSKDGYKTHTGENFGNFYESRFIQKTDSGKWLFCTSSGIAAFDPGTDTVERTVLFDGTAEPWRYDYFNITVLKEDGSALKVLPCFNESTYRLVWLNDDYSQVVATAPMKQEDTYLLTKRSLLFRLNNEDNKRDIENSRDAISKYYLSCGDGKLYQIINDDFSTESRWYAFSFTPNGDVEVLGRKVVSRSYPTDDDPVLKYDSNHLLIWRRKLGDNPKRPSQRLDIVCIE